MMTWIEMWNKIASSYDDDDYEELENILLHKTFYQHSEKNVEIINIILNIVLAAICIFLIKVKVWQLPLIIMGVDILFTFINATIMNFIEKRYQAVLKGYKSEKYLKILKEKRDFYKDKCKNCSSCSYYSRVCRHSVSLKKRVRNLNSIIKTIEKTVENTAKVDVVKDIKENKQIEALKLYKKVIENLKKESFNELSEKHQEDINNSIAITEILLKEVEKNPSSYRIVQNTFDIYIIELINTITAVNKLDESFKEEYYEKINVLVEEYNNHVTTLIERVKKYNLTNIDVNINTLLKEMKNEEGNGRG